MKILAGPSSQNLALDIANTLNIPLVELQFKPFYDGETYLRINGNVEGESILLVQSTHYPQEKHLLELLFLASELKNLGAEKVIAVVPYLCYARADKRKLKGEVLSHQLTLSLLSKAGVNSLITANVHNPKAFLESSSDLEKIDLNLFNYIGRYFKDELTNFIIVGPDRGAESDVKTLASTLLAPYVLFDKVRDPHTQEVVMQAPEIDFKGQHVLVVDDVITLGGTAKRACQLALTRNPESVSFVSIHAMSKPQVYTEMKDMGVVNIISTNTIPSSDLEQIDISPYLSKLIEEKFL